MGGGDRERESGDERLGRGELTIGAGDEGEKANLGAQRPNPEQIQRPRPQGPEVTV